MASVETLDRVSVRPVSEPVAYVDPFAAYMALRTAWGPGETYLLESLAGPAKDLKQAICGFRPLVTLTIRGTQVVFDGLPALARRCRDAALAAGAIVAEGAGHALPDRFRLWDLLRTVEAQFAVDHPAPGASFRFGFFGYLGYDTAWSVERLPYRIPPAPDAAPEICLAIYQGSVQFDLEHRTAEIVVNRSPAWPDIDVAALRTLIEDAKAPPEAVPAVPAPRRVTDSIVREHYLSDVERCLDYIRIGDIYQVQVGHELAITTDADPLDVYLRLRARNPSPYMYLADLGETTVVGASPELFVGIENGTITMRPIAGTIARGRTEAEDQAAIETLKHDEKEIAEHVMLVDLCRNDMGRVCVNGTLEVDELIVVERYSHVFHLVSNVVAQGRPDADAYDVIAATLPAGTMTGAPKIRAMEIIEELETARRGIYAGTLGLIDFSGYVRTALCIRTALKHGDTYRLRASAGVVADSVPLKEWRETLMKMRGTYWAITGEELSDEHTGH